MIVIQSVKTDGRDDAPDERDDAPDAGPSRAAVRSVQADTVDKLRWGILTGRFVPGERLVEASLCTVLGVSRTTVREALRRLEGERLITIVPNKGPSVATITWREAEAIYRVRELLEADAAAIFAERATEPEIRAMRAAWKNFVKAVAADDAIGRLTATNAFYNVLLDGCANPIISEILQGLLVRINLLRFRSMSQRGRSKVSAEELRSILKAVEKHDPHAARSAATDHVIAARASAQAVYAQLQDPQVAGGGSSTQIMSGHSRGEDRSRRTRPVRKGSEV